ncbi:MAG: ATPase [Fusobacterium sp.]|uniref:VirB4 family type IV secretion/conjugal transfer ATPase n=1 Tax=Fusobacterium sp. TaxID=68766 RepID=UPI0015A5AB41|nr:ATPase [uncultured Fusobacterium sp.]
MLLREYTNEKKRLSNYLPWLLFCDEGIVLNQNGTLQKTIEFRGLDLDREEYSSIQAKMSQLNNIFKRIDGGWTISIDCIRSKSKKYIKSPFPDKAGNLIENQREKYFNSGNHYESIYYMTFIYLTPTEASKKITSLVVDEIEMGEKVNNDIKKFKKEFEEKYELLKSVFLKARVRELTSEETLTYLHSLVSNTEQNVILPNPPMYLNNYISDTYVIGGLKPMLGKKHLRVVSIIGFPQYTHPSFFDELNKLDIEYRWNTRYMIIDKLEALSLLEKKRKAWFSGRKSLLQVASEQFTQRESTKVNRDSEEKAYQIEAETDNLRGEYYAEGYYSSCIILKDDDLENLEEKVKLIKKVITRIGMTVVEESVNTIEAWLGSMSGNIYNNLRTPILNTVTFSHLIPSSAIWAGENYNKHLQAPPLIYTQTDGSTPFYFNLHVGDVGHTLILGPTGAGKSVLLGTIASQWRKYVNRKTGIDKPAKVYFFDKGSSSRVLTHAVGGKFYFIGEDEMSFQPLAYLDNELEKEWALEWIISILEQENLQINPEIKSELWRTIEILGKTEQKFRTMTSFVAMCQNKKVKETLEAFTMKGALGKYFDGAENTVKDDKWQVFEMEEVSKNQQVIAPLLQYLFHVIERNLDGSPTLIILDEGWLYLKRQDFASKIQEWLKVLRRANACVVFASQELSDIEKSPIFSTLLEACKTKIFLPNPSANNDNNIKLYEKFGINSRELEYITNGIQKRDYYYKSDLGSRKFQLQLSKEELWLLASSTKDDLIKAIEIEKDIKIPDEFLDRWFIYKAGINANK